jgi:hypothetical protein
VPHARATTEPMQCYVMRCVTCRVVSCTSTGVGWFCHLGWLRGRDTNAIKEELPFLPSLCCLTRHTTPSSCRVASEYSPSHPLRARSFGRAGLRNWRSHRDTYSGVCGQSGFWGASLRLLTVFFIGSSLSPSWWCPIFFGQPSSTSWWTFGGRHCVHLPTPIVVRDFEQLTIVGLEPRCLEHGSLRRVHLYSQIG